MKSRMTAPSARRFPHKIQIYAQFFENSFMWGDFANHKADSVYTDALPGLKQEGPDV